MPGPRHQRPTQRPGGAERAQGDSRADCRADDRPDGGASAQGSQAAQHLPYKDVPFEELVALVEKLNRLKEGGVVVAERKVIDN